MAIINSNIAISMVIYIPVPHYRASVTAPQSMQQTGSWSCPLAPWCMEARRSKRDSMASMKRKELSEAIARQQVLLGTLSFACQYEQQLERRHRKRLKTLSTLSEEHIRVAACLSMLTNYDRDDIIRDYCDFQWTAMHPDAEASATLDWQAESSRLCTAVACMKDFQPAQQGNPEWPDHFAAARWLTEKLVFEWLVQCNFKGVAPSTARVLEQYIASWPEASLGDKARTHLELQCAGKRSQEWWARSFRKRWLFTYRKLPTQPPQSEDQLRQKVRISDTLCIHKLTHVLSRWPHKWGHMQRQALCILPFVYKLLH